MHIPATWLATCIPHGFFLQGDNSPWPPFLPVKIPSKGSVPLDARPPQKQHLQDTSHQYLRRRKTLPRHPRALLQLVATIQLQEGMSPRIMALHSLRNFRWTAIMVGIPIVVVTSYVLYQRGMGQGGLSLYVPCANKGTVILGREQKPLTMPPEGPLTAKHS